MLVTPAQLSRQLNDPRLVLLQVGVEKDYQAGHIPGARWFNLDWIEKEPSPLALELPDLAKLDSVFGSLGVGPDSKIVLYFSQDWVTPTTRVWFTLDYMGLGERAAILDGGFPARRAPVSVSTGAAPPCRGDSPHAPIPRWWPRPTG
jgi:thiosulfate/3-mercaptopyruvate sulfurtransferase